MGAEAPSDRAEASLTTNAGRLTCTKVHEALKAPERTRARGLSWSRAWRLLHSGWGPEPAGGFNPPASDPPPLPPYGTAGCALRCAGRQGSHSLGSPVRGLIGSTARSRGTRCGSSEAR